jgi:glyoxylase-like metal-dependent hydrolase (beta-lactamase superfamily II)/rhodanese-related sulfurtransferase
VYFEQIVRQDIGCAAYVVGSTDAGEAAVVDPRIDMVDEILAIVAREGMAIRYIIETHNHADHISGHARLSELTGATIALHKDGTAEYPHLALEDGQELTLGEVRLRVIHTPGHRPEHISIAAIDTTRGNDPWLVLTGDSLSIGDVARPDLAVDGHDGATALFHSLHEKLLQLPAGTMVYPGHVAGSLCGRVNNRMTGTTIGFERVFNPALTISDLTEFVRYMNESLPERPPNMARIVELNMSSECPEVADVHRLAIEEVVALQADEAHLLDVRSPAEFGAGHIPGAINVHLDGGQFQNRVGLVFPPGARLILITESDDEADRTVEALSVIGFTDIAGSVTGGMSRWEQSGQDYEATTGITAQELSELLDTDPSLQIIDVRERNEWQEGHIAVAAPIPFHKVRNAAGSLDPTRPCAVICAGGTRSMIAASILQALGFTSVLNVEGGMGAWNAAHLPIVTARVAATTVAAAR